MNQKKDSHPKQMYSSHRLRLGLYAILFGPREHRLRVKQELLRIFANYFTGEYVGDLHKIWHKDKEFIQRFRFLSPNNYFSEDRKFALREFAKSVTHLDGAIAECGCCTGVSSWFIAEALPKVDFYLFDSFEGLSEPSLFDTAPAGTRKWTKGDLYSSEKTLRNNLSQYDHIHVLAGWIPSRFQEVNKLHFRLVHIDVDLYQPTYDSLSFFYERMVDGGIIIMDDYGFENCPGAYKAANEFMECRKEHIIHLPTGQGVVIRQF